MKRVLSNRHVFIVLLIMVDYTRPRLIFVDSDRRCSAVVDKRRRHYSFLTCWSSFGMYNVPGQWMNDDGTDGQFFLEIRGLDAIVISKSVLLQGTGVIFKLNGFMVYNVGVIGSVSATASYFLNQSNCVHGFAYPPNIYIRVCKVRDTSTVFHT